LIELDNTDDFSLIHQTIEAVTKPGDYIEATIACITLAAAKILTALHENPSADIPREASDWAS
jgi:hypothetical protein